MFQLSRDEFEALNEDLFASVVEPIRAAIDDAELDKNDIDEIVLVGGSTRIPKVRQVVGSFFEYVIVLLEHLFSTTIYLEKRPIMALILN